MKGRCLILARINTKGFSLVEILVAAAVVCLAVFAVVAVVRKGQEQMWVEKHRRVARAMIDTILEAPKYSPGNYASILKDTTSDSVALDTYLKAGRRVAIDSQNDSGVVYRRIRASLRWREPGAGASDSVAMEKWVPQISSPINIAPWASNITSSPHFTGNLGGTFYDCCPWMAVDGIIGLRISGDWSGQTANPTPWIGFKWNKTHSVYKIVFWCRVNPGPFGATAADVYFYKGMTQVRQFSVSGIPTATARPSLCKTVFFTPTVMDSMKVQVTAGSWDYSGFSEIELFE